jgi:hypothetical protein
MNVDKILNQFEQLQKEKVIKNNDLLKDSELASLEKLYSNCKSIQELRKIVIEDVKFINDMEGQFIRMSFDEEYGISVMNNPPVNVKPKGFEVHFVN